jgi:hypothetical protein
MTPIERIEAETARLRAVTAKLHRPTIVCLCGSTRFSEAFRKANLEETLAGKIVLSVGCDTKSDDALGLPPETKTKLDALHLKKIDMADEVLILNAKPADYGLAGDRGYIGESTQRELVYALAHGKKVRFLDERAGNAFLEERSHALGGLMAELASPQVAGVKADAAKPRWSLLPLVSINAIVRVMEFGAQKYSVDNWQHVPDARRRYYDAALRHLTAWWAGEENDPESGEHHLAHLGCCVLFLLWFELKEEKHVS